MNRSPLQRGWLELRRLNKNALPLVIAQILGMSMTAVDSIVAGQLGSTQLAAGGAGGSLLFAVQIICIGMIAGLAPWIGRLIGEKRRQRLGVVLSQSLWFSLVIGLLGLGGAALIYSNLAALGFNPEITSEIRRYLSAGIWSIPSVALIALSRAWCEVSNNGNTFMRVQVIGALVNLLANFGLGLGLMGLPKLGIFGIGIATSLVQASMVMAMIFFIFGRKTTMRPPYISWLRPDFTIMRRIAIDSAPLCASLVFEVGMFVAISLLTTRVGVVDGAAHTIAVQISGVLFMVPLGISMALSARIAIAFGKAHYPLVSHRIRSAFLTMGITASFNAILLLSFHRFLPLLFSENPEVLTLASTLLLLSALFQLSDSIQVILGAILRGLNDTRVPMLINGFCFWIIGIGGGSVLHLLTKLGAIAYWIGLVLGLTAAALAMAYRLRLTLRKLREQPWPQSVD